MVIPVVDKFEVQADGLVRSSFDPAASVPSCDVFIGGGQEGNELLLPLTTEMHGNRLPPPPFPSLPRSRAEPALQTATLQHARWSRCTLLPHNSQVMLPCLHSSASVLRLALSGELHAGPPAETSSSSPGTW